MSVYGQAKQSDRRGKERRVTIREVNMDQLFVIGESALGDKMRVSFGLQDPLVAVPYPGELWSLIQNGTTWFLNKRLENATESVPAKALAPGDRRIEARNKVYISGDDVIINGISFNDLLARVEALEGP